VATRSKIVGMISFVRENFVQHMVRIVKNIREEIVVHVSSQLAIAVAAVFVSS